MAQNTDSFGVRLRGARKQSGLSQQELASVSGVSVSLIRKLEQGERQDTRLETARQLAAALHVPTVRLMSAEPEYRADAATTELWASVRQAIALPSDSVPEPPTVEGVRGAVQSALSLQEEARFSELAALLPGLIRDARVLAEREPEGRPVHTRLMQLTGAVLVQHRQFETAETVLGCALDVAGDRHQAASLVSVRCWLLLRRGRLQEARELAVRWADEMEPQRLSRATALDLVAWGRMLLRVSGAAVRDSREGEAADALRLARAAAVAMRPGLVRDPVLGAFNAVAVQRKSAENAMIMNQPDRVLTLTRLIPPVRHSDHHRHMLDVANAQARTRKYAEAAETLQGLHSASPEWFSQQRYAQDILSRIVARRRTLTPEMRRLAEAVRLPL